MSERPYRRVPQGLRGKIYERQSGMCAVCGKHCKRHELTAHHIQGFAQGGSSIDIRNLAGVCRPCHDDVERRKSTESFGEIVRRAGGIWPFPSGPKLIRRR